LDFLIRHHSISLFLSQRFSHAPSLRNGGEMESERSCQQSCLNFSGVRACLAALVRRVLRVSGSGRKSHCASAPVLPEPLQPVRHGKIERMNPRRQGVEQKETKGTKSLFKTP
jgi:hypothetical protein